MSASEVRPRCGVAVTVIEAEATVSRLPVYLRILNELVDDGQNHISSEQLAELAGVNAAKVRKDLSYLGSYGVRGVGYEVPYLVYQIQRELGLNHDWPVVIVGAGPSGLSAAIQLKQLDPNLSVVLLEKGSEVGAHILSGAVLDPSGLDALLLDLVAQRARPPAA